MPSFPSLILPHLVRLPPASRLHACTSPCYQLCRLKSSHRGALSHRGFSSSSASFTSSACDSSDRPSGPLDSVTEWVLAAGGHCSKVALRLSPEFGRSVQCTEAVSAAGETLIRVPERCLLTLTRAKDSDIGRLILANARELAQRGSFLSAFILQERDKGTASPFHPYIDALPHHSSYSFPVQWPDSTLALLQGTSALPLITNHRRDIDADYLTLMSLITARTVSHLHVSAMSADRRMCGLIVCRFASPVWRPEEFEWARLAVTSRAFGANINGVTDELVCTPIVDMINHSSTPNTTWGWNKATAAFETESNHPITVGEHITESYGDKCNSVLLAYYAFVLPDNPHNTSTVAFALAPSDERTRMKKISLLDLLHDTFAEQLDVSFMASWTEVAERALSFLRVAVADEDELSRLMEEERREPAAARKERIRAGGAKRVRVISQSNEQRVWRVVANEVQRRLSEFTCTLDDDERLLREKRYPEGSPEWTCVMMRCGEKRVLRWWQRSAQLVERMLEQGVLAIFSHERELDDVGLERYRVTELQPMLRWPVGSRRVRVVAAADT